MSAQALVDLRGGFWSNARYGKWADYGDSQKEMVWLLRQLEHDFFSRKYVYLPAIKVYSHDLYRFLMKTYSLTRPLSNQITSSVYKRDISAESEWDQVH